ncbi:helix-turn-helix transcriptional regulator [Niastella caeni]|uniref:Helix-turn-helix transcriptional regulator n=1 Tax=Niastella caeni TaxID=2569763 RepID=A0A4S8HVH1_9BACT|nr:AraC family transcriptional regulator [Niastella caeni]THU39600.1 helix-turn-helix transcriptional regulator [Niastella caeni]
MLQKIKPYSKYVLDAIKCIKQHIDANPFHYKTAAELLEHVSAPNRNSVEKAFKDVYGAGIKEYQVRQRLEASKEFLSAGMTKKLAASKCLYSSQSTFSAAFKKEFKMTPTEWQMIYA